MNLGTFYAKTKGSVTFNFFSFLSFFFFSEGLLRRAQREEAVWFLVLKAKKMRKNEKPAM